jgi:insulysin
VNNIKRLVFRFPLIPDQSAFWRTQPAAYVASVLGHEGKNSLLSELVRQDLATELAASLSSQLKEQHWGLCVEITLTEKGLEHVQSVTRLVWAHLN